MNRRWLVVVCGASLVVSVPRVVSAADNATGLSVRTEVRGGFRPSLFPGASASRLPFVVSLREAWESGAHSWSVGRRAAFATDAGVRATGVGLSTRTNAQRADRDPAQWLPVAEARCAYVARWITVKVAWGLAADPAEVVRLRRVIASCPSPPSTQPTTQTTIQPTTPTTTQAATSTSSTAEATSTSSTAVSNVLGELAKVKIIPEYTVGYDRTLFPHWKDFDGDGCDTRKEVLIRDSTTTAVVGTRCVVVSGTWYSPYDGVTWTNPSDVDIDHVVALNEAWQSGAYAWTPKQRENFANDLTDSRTLLAVTDSVNQSKSDKDPSDWLPPLATYRCMYLANWVSIKVRWSLAMDEAEFAAVKSGLANCRP